VASAAWESTCFTYDALNRLERYLDVLGVAAYYTYDVLGRMTGVRAPSEGQASFAYDASRNLTRKELGNGIVAWAGYDQAERITSLRYAKADGTAVAYFDYGWDAAGRITRIAREADLVVYYQYDDVDRLTGEVWRKQSDGDQIYGFWYDYDAGHNRVKMRRESSAGVEAESAYYGYDEANALTRRAVWTPPSTQVDTYYYYDENGSLVREVEGEDATYYQYGPHGLVTRIAPPTGNPWNFYYDGQLNRYCIDKGGQATYYLWDGLNLLEERAADGGLIARYTHGHTPIYGLTKAGQPQMNAARDR
jgi:YD repeat-containing protein